MVAGPLSVKALENVEDKMDVSSKVQITRKDDIEHDLYFNADNLAEARHNYVLFVDIMGMKSTMLRSFSKSTIFMGKMHCALSSLRSGNSRIRVYPVMDGAYVVSADRDAIFESICYLFNRLGKVFVATEKPENCFLVRGCLAYGPVVDGNQIDKGVCMQLADDTEYKGRLLFGFPMSLAYEGEHKAPPFGIYLDTTVRVVVNSKLSGIWYRWCKDEILKKSLMKSLNSYFSWAKSNHIELMYEESRIHMHEQLCSQYWR